MNPASELIRSYRGLSIGEDDFRRMLGLIDSQPGRGERHESIEHVLRSVELSPAQVAAIAQSREVRESVSLQLVVKRFVREREYAAARDQHARRSEWRTVMELLASLSF